MHLYVSYPQVRRGRRAERGEFYTPDAVGEIMALIMDPEPGMSCYDPTCGSVGLHIKCELALLRRKWRCAPAVVKYSVLNEGHQLFASKYRLYLPTEEELQIEIEREHALAVREQRAMYEVMGR